MMSSRSIHGAEYVGENCEGNSHGNIAVTLGQMEMSTIYKGKMVSFKAFIYYLSQDNIRNQIRQTNTGQNYFHLTQESQSHLLLRLLKEKFPFGVHEHSVCIN